MLPLGNRRLAGLLLAAGAVQFLTLIMISEALAPGYSIKYNLIGDLGTIPESRSTSRAMALSERAGWNSSSSTLACCSCWSSEGA